MKATLTEYEVIHSNDTCRSLSFQIHQIESLQESYHVLRYGGMKNPPLWGKIVVKFSHLLLTLSSAINIIIYSYKVSVGLSCSFMHGSFELDIIKR